MYAQGLKYFTDIPLVIGGMLIFFTLFMALIIRAFKTTSDFSEAALLPLADEETIHERH